MELHIEKYLGWSPLPEPNLYGLRKKMEKLKSVSVSERCGCEKTKRVLSDCSGGRLNSLT